MPFERFDKAAAAAVTKDPEVVVATSGVISLTWRAYEQVGTPSAVEFFFDRDRSVLAIASCSPDDPNGYLVRQPRSASEERSDVRGTVSVRGVSVLKYYGVDYRKKIRKTPFVDGEMLCFEVPMLASAPATETQPDHGSTDVPPH